MPARALDICMGPRAAEIIGDNGWRGRDVQLLLGASGGPKWLILGHLDRLLFGDFLLRGRQTPLRAVGSSVGSWRHACLAQSEPAAAIDRFEKIYLNQRYGARPTPSEISAISTTMLAHILGRAGAAAVADHPQLHSYIVTARGRGFASSRQPFILGAGMGVAALGNAFSRRLLAPSFQRVVFHSKGAPPLGLADFTTQQVPLATQSVMATLHASGAIPFVLNGERDIPGAPRGQYWDGGIIDYHFNLRDFHPPYDNSADRSDGRPVGLTLYPHFRADITPGWFDKLLPWRRQLPQGLDNLVLLSPRAAFIDSLPLGKIPDRSDFQRLDAPARERYWKTCIERSKVLAEDFARQIEDTEPLRNVRLIGRSSA